MNANEQFEIKAALFHRMTGIVAPGKDAALISEQDDSARQERWRQFLEQNGELIDATLRLSEVFESLEEAPPAPRARIATSRAGDKRIFSVTAEIDGIIHPHRIEAGGPCQAVEVMQKRFDAFRVLSIVDVTDDAPVKSPTRMEDWEKAAAIKKGECDDEWPGYDTLKAWLQKTPRSMLPGILRQVVTCCMAGEVFQPGRMMEFVLKAEDDWCRPGHGVLRDDAPVKAADDHECTFYAAHFLGKNGAETMTCYWSRKAAEDCSLRSDSLVAISGPHTIRFKDREGIPQPTVVEGEL